MPEWRRIAESRDVQFEEGLPHRTQKSNPDLATLPNGESEGTIDPEDVTPLGSDSDSPMLSQSPPSSPVLPAPVSTPDPPAPP